MTYKFGGSDELFIFHASADFMNFLLDINQVLYNGMIIIVAIILFFAMYLPIYLNEKSVYKLSLNQKQTENIDEQVLVSK